MQFSKVLVSLVLVALASASEYEKQEPQQPPLNMGPFESANQCLAQLQSGSCQSTLNTLSILRPEFGNIGALLTYVLQTLGARGRALNNAPVGGKPIFTTLPFEDANITQLISVWNDFANSVKPVSPEDEPNKPTFYPGLTALNQLGSSPRAGSGNRTILADLNFATLPQLFGLVGR